MADNTEQYQWLVKIKENLEILFADRPEVFVAGDLLRIAGLRLRRIALRAPEQRRNRRAAPADGGGVGIFRPRRAAASPAEFARPLHPMYGGLDHHAWYAGNTERNLKPIGYRAANPRGLHDIYGNVEELMLDLYRSDLFPGLVGAAVIRGGSIHTQRSELTAERSREVPLYGEGGAKIISKRRCRCPCLIR